MEDKSSLEKIGLHFEDKTGINDKIIGDPFFMFSKQVKSNNIEVEEIHNHNKKNQLLEVLNSLYNLDEFKSLDEINLRFNCKRWIRSLFSNYPNINREHMENLIHDFTDSMNTKMKEKEMYAVSIIAENRLILCHSRMGEKSINPDWKVFVRMLDKDNIKRYVSFEFEENDIKVMFYEKNRTKFFIDWLGISEKDAIYEYGGKNKFYSEIEGFPITLEINDEDFEKVYCEMRDLWKICNNISHEGNSGVNSHEIRNLGKNYANMLKNQLLKWMKLKRIKMKSLQIYKRDLSRLIVNKRLYSGIQISKDHINVVGLK